MSQRWLLESNQLIAPNGWTFNLRTLLMHRADIINGRQNIDTQPWSGWRIRQQFLIPPGPITHSSPKMTPANLRAFSRWVHQHDEAPAQFQLFD